MKGLLALLVCLALWSPVATSAEWCADADGGVKYSTTERVVNLPQDQSQWYTTVMGNPTDSDYRQVVGWFQSNDALRGVTKSTHFSALPSTSQMYQKRYAGSVPALPCVRIQDAQGNVIYQVSGRNLPLSAEALANSIETSCLRRRQAQPDASPSLNLHYHFDANQDKGDSVKPDDTQPDVFLKGEDEMLIPIWVYCAVGVVAVVAGIATEWVATYRKR